MKDYKRITVQDIIDYIKSEPEKFPDGMKTVIVSGDFEGNYTHEKHEIQDMVGGLTTMRSFRMQSASGMKCTKVNPAFGIVKRRNDMYINSIEYLKIYLRRNGYEILDGNAQYNDVCPHLVAWHRESDAMVYIDLRVWKSLPQYRPQPWYKNWMHRRKIKSEFNKWLQTNKWRGKHLFDVIEVFLPYGCIGSPVIDHIVDVKL